MLDKFKPITLTLTLFLEKKNIIQSFSDDKFSIIKWLPLIILSWFSDKTFWFEMFFSILTPFCSAKFEFNFARKCRFFFILYTFLCLLGMLNSVLVLYQHKTVLCNNQFINKTFTHGNDVYFCSNIKTSCLR